MQITYLKVKIKSLAAEQAIIRHEKRKAKDTDLINGLQNHKIHRVRPEIRAALMAYGILRGRTREQIEPNAKRPIDEKRVAALIMKYGPPMKAAA